jgi:hypothetical protein
VHQSENGTVKAFLQPLPDDASGNATTTDAQSIYGTFHLQGGNGIGIGDNNCSIDITFADGRAVAKQTGPSDLCDITPAANAGGVYTRVTTGDIDGPAPVIAGMYRRSDGATVETRPAPRGYDFALTVRPADPIRMQADTVEHDGTIRLVTNDRCAFDFVFLQTTMTVVQRGPAADCHLRSGTTASGSYTRTSG